MKEDLDQCLLKCKLDKNLKFCQKKSGEKCKMKIQIIRKIGNFSHSEEIEEKK